MQLCEIPIITKYLAFADVVAWNQTRNVMLSVLRPYLKQKNLTADEFFPLPIDESYQAKQELTTEISNEDVAWWNNYCENYKKGQH